MLLAHYPSHPPRMRPSKSNASIERGRSRDISPVALARRSSEERRRFSRRPINSHSAVPVPFVDENGASSSKLAASPLPAPRPLRSGPTTTRHSLGRTKSPTTSRLLSCRQEQLRSESFRYPQLDSLSARCHSKPPNQITTISHGWTREASPIVEDGPLPARTLEEQMQEAYAAEDMQLARKLYLKIRGIDVTSDNDPRLLHIRDEDFVFIPGGTLHLDDESLAVLKEAERREEEVLRACGGGGRARRSTVKAQAQLSSPDAPRAMQDPNARSIEDSSCKSFADDRCRPHGASSLSATSLQLGQVLACVRGPLFQEEESLNPAQSSHQRRLIESLLRVTEDISYERVIVDTSKGTVAEHASNSTCIACSLDSTTSISRSSSWASVFSTASLSTPSTTPPSSPMSVKKALPPLQQRAKFRPVVHSCSRRLVTHAVPLDSSPLSPSPLQPYFPARNRVPSEADVPRSAPRQVVKRVKRSMATLLDVLTKVQSSYIRSLQFTLAPLEISDRSCDSPSPNRPLRPCGFRAVSSDVRRFAPPSEQAPSHEPTFPSESNIPLADANPEPAPPRIFTPIAFVPPSPLRPRYIPLSPEWRLRPVANPVTLRLKALQNVLCAHGLRWEGKAHAGSLGCGRERLTGVAFEGLGGSRLAFEAR